MINKVEGPGPIRTLQPTRRTTKTGETGATGFSRHLEEAEGAEGAAAAHGATGVGSVAGVFGLQEVDDALARAAKGKLRAQDILDRLEELRMDLLSGTLSRGKLLQLAQIVNARRREVDDPKLASILDEIDLRAQVELAKHSPSGG